MRVLIALPAALRATIGSETSAASAQQAHRAGIVTTVPVTETFKTASAAQ